MTTTTLTPPRSNGRLMLALVVSLLALPFAIGAGLYFGGWKPARTIQHGQLLNPPVAFPVGSLLASNGQPLPGSELQGKWLLVLSLNGPCQAECVSRIDEMRRIQVSLNKDMGRLRRVVVSQHTEAPELAAAGRQQPDLLLLAAPGQSLNANAGEARYQLHIVDPQGRRVMDYPPEVAAREVRADLDRLLKFAWTG